MPPLDERIQTRVSTELHEWLSGRGKLMHEAGADLQARTELEMWRAALAAELRRIRLTLAQMNCIADVAKGSMLSPGAIAINIPLVYAGCFDEFGLDGDGSYGKKWGIDEQELLTYLQGLGPTADHALAGAVARWWKGDHGPDDAGWAAVGIRVVTAPKALTD